MGRPALRGGGGPQPDDRRMDRSSAPDADARANWPVAERGTSRERFTPIRLEACSAPSALARAGRFVFCAGDKPVAMEARHSGQPVLYFLLLRRHARWKR